MKRIDVNLIKDLIISVLIVICIALVISVIFYNKISLTQYIPESEEYMLSDDMQENLNKTVANDSKEIITTYYIDAADLKKYEKTKEYNKGKKNPFAVESEETTEDTNITNNINNGVNSSSTSSNIDNNKYYEDEGIK